MTAAPAEGLPDWVTWQQRPFPDANLILLTGSQPALVDSGFVGHAQGTVDWVRAQTHDLALVVNTHWHSDHVEANWLLHTSAPNAWIRTPPQPSGTAPAGSSPSPC